MNTLLKNLLLNNKTVILNHQGKIRIYLVLMIILNFQSLFYAQNLVPNWSFEIYDTCPTGGSQIHIFH
jgi:hypothetical protein